MTWISAEGQTRLERLSPTTLEEMSLVEALAVAEPGWTVEASVEVPFRQVFVLRDGDRWSIAGVAISTRTGIDNGDEDDDFEGPGIRWPRMDAHQRLGAFACDTNAQVIAGDLLGLWRTVAEMHTTSERWLAPRTGMPAYDGWTAVGFVASWRTPDGVALRTGPERILLSFDALTCAFASEVVEADARAFMEYALYNVADDALTEHLADMPDPRVVDALLQDHLRPWAQSTEQDPVLGPPAEQVRERIREVLASPGWAWHRTQRLHG